jgi:hypothetical protein
LDDARYYQEAEETRNLSRGEMLRNKYSNLSREERLARIDDLAKKNFEREIDNAIDNATSQTRFQLPAQNPSTGEGLVKVTIKADASKPINYHHNMEFRGIKNAPGNQRVEVRYHSPNNNPSAAGTYSSQHPTVQINKYNSQIYMLPNGNWKPFNSMTAAEKSDIHMP